RVISLDALRSFTASAGSLSEADWRSAEKVEGVDTVVPVGIVSGVAGYGGRDYNADIIATTNRFPLLVNQQVEYGSFFQAGDLKKNVVVIGRDVAEELFREH